MYYSHQCSHCSKLFYTYNSNKERAAQTLFEGIKQHLTEFDEDRKETEFDEHPTIEANQMYEAMRESSDPPSGGYEV